VLAAADEVVLIDIAPEALLDRLRSGKIYPPERVKVALNQFFRIETLTALREIALRQVGAKRVAPESVGTRDQLGAPQPVGERLIALVEPNPDSKRMVRCAWRLGQPLGSAVDLLWVKRPGTSLTHEQDCALADLRHLASLLGATLLIEEADNVAATIARVAAERGTTTILMGRSRQAHGLHRLRTPLPLELMNRLPEAEVRIFGNCAPTHARAR
jgi:two-component system sensor histidine kinase KdpD